MTEEEDEEGLCEEKMVVVARGWSGQKRQDLPARLTDKDTPSPTRETSEKAVERERERV